MLKARIKNVARAFCAALVMLMFAGGMGFDEPAYAGTGVTELEVIIRQYEGEPTAAAEVFLHNPAGMGAGQLEAVYDPLFFTLDDLTAGELLEQEGFIFEPNTTEAGLINAGWMGLTGIYESGSLFEAFFQGDGEETLELQLQNIRLYDVDGNPIWIGADELRLQIGTATVWVNHDAALLEAAPFIQKGVTMLPLRFVSEQLGAKVTWKPETNQVGIKDDHKSIVLTIDTAEALVDGEEEKMEASPVVVNGRTFVPLKFVQESLGAAAAWDEKAQTVAITITADVEETEPRFEGGVTISGSGATFTNVKFLVNLKINEAVNFGGMAVTSRVELGNDVSISFADGDTVWFLKGDVNLAGFELTLSGAAATIAGNGNSFTEGGAVIFSEAGLAAEDVIFKTDLEIKDDATFQDVCFDADATVTVSEDKTLTLKGEIEIKDGWTVTFTGDGNMIRDEAEITGPGTAIFE